jgi:prepilin-type N-terminal cleavage/methylation domain-containing protein
MNRDEKPRVKRIFQWAVPRKTETEGHMKHTPHRTGFTLIELLVVVTILATLVSLLLPALDRVKQAARVVQCAGTQKQVALAFIVYAQANKNDWPRRTLYTGEKPTHIKWSNATYDWRPILRTFIPSINGMLQCPMSPAVNLDKATSTRVESSYAFYAPWQFIGKKNAIKVDDYFDFGNKKFRLLMGDYLNDQDNAWGITSHPDRPSKTRTVTSLGSADYFSRWENSYSSARGALDLNFASTDGSVATYSNLAPLDPRFTIVTYTNNTSLNVAFRWWLPDPDQ